MHLFFTIFPNLSGFPCMVFVLIQTEQCYEGEKVFKVLIDSACHRRVSLSNRSLASLILAARYGDPPTNTQKCNSLNKQSNRRLRLFNYCGKVAGECKVELIWFRFTFIWMVQDHNPQMGLSYLGFSAGWTGCKNIM